MKPSALSSALPNAIQSESFTDHLSKSEGDRTGLLRCSGLAIGGGLLLLSVLSAQAADAPAAVAASTGADTRSAEEIQAELNRVQAEANRLKQLLAGKQATPDAPPEEAATIDFKPDDSSTLETVVVRQRPKLDRVKDVPASVSVVSGDDLRAVGADSLRDITRRAANVSRANTSNARNVNLVIRGIGRRGTTEAQDPQVGINIDDVPYAYPGLAAWDFVDIDTVEVARGPQGTSGGHNPSFGLLSLTTKKPTFTPTNEFSLRLGQRDAIFGTAATGGAIVDDLLAWRGTFYVNKFEGPYGNKYWNGGQRVGDQTYTDRLKISGKTQFLLKLSSSYSVLASVDLQPRSYENDNGLNFFHAVPEFYSDAFHTPTAGNIATQAQTRLARRWFTSQSNYSFANDYANYYTGIQNNDNQLPLITGTRGAAITQNWVVDNDTTLTSITAYRNLYFDARNDEGTPFDISTQGGGGVRYKQFTQELRLVSQIGKLADYRTGLFYIRNSYHVDSKTGFGSDAGGWFANNAQYNALDGDAAGRYLLSQSLDGLRKLATTYIQNTSPAIYGNATWHLSEQASLVTGLRVTKESRKSDTFSLISDNGFGGGLNASVSSFGVELGGFDSYYNNGAAAVNVRDGFLIKNGSTVGAVNVAAGQVALTTDTTNAARAASATAAADAAAKKYFGAASWTALSDKQKQQLAQAQALRKAQIGQIFNTIRAESFKKTQYNFVLSPSYKFNEQATGYFSYQHGEKPGLAQVINGNSLPAKGEDGNHYELGLKTTTFNRTLSLNSDVFLSKLKDFQQSSAVVDEFTTNFNNDGTTYYTVVAANVPKVQIYGLELDAAYSGIRHFVFSLSGAYNVAEYKEFPLSAMPPEGQAPAVTTGDNQHPAAPAFQDVSGRILPGAAKYTANLGVQYRYPVLGDKEFHVDANYNYTSRYNSDVTLSSYSWISGYSITDLSVGLAKANGAFDASILVKNLFNEEGKAYGFVAGALDTTQRWIGVQFTARL